MADGTPRMVYQFGRPLRLKKDQIEDFLFWFSHHPMPDDSNMTMKWVGGFWEINFICDLSEDMPFGASQPMMLWFTSHVPKLLVKYNINANNTEYEARFKQK